MCIQFYNLIFFLSPSFSTLFSLILFCCCIVIYYWQHRSQVFTRSTHLIVKVASTPLTSWNVISVSNRLSKSATTSSALRDRTEQNRAAVEDYEEKFFSFLFSLFFFLRKKISFFSMIQNDVDCICFKSSYGSTV